MPISKLTSKFLSLLGLSGEVQSAISGEVPSAIKALMSVSATKGPTEAELASLLDLSVHSASQDAAEDLLSGQESVRLCVEETKNARSYCGYTLVRDRTRKSLRGRDYVSLAWRLDFMRPDKYHVRQAVLLEDLSDVIFDEWITIGKEHYWFGPNWLRTDDALDQRPHRVLLAEKYLEFLSSASPISVGMYRYRDAPYLLLEYQVIELPTDFCGVSLTTKGMFHISIWVNASTTLLAKAVVVSEDQCELEQVFAAYNEEVVVKQPHVGMEPTPGEPGTYTVTDTRRIPSPFHE